MTASSSTGASTVQKQNYLQQIAELLASAGSGAVYYGSLGLGTGYEMGRQGFQSGIGYGAIAASKAGELGKAGLSSAYGGLTHYGSMGASMAYQGAKKGASEYLPIALRFIYEGITSIGEVKQFKKKDWDDLVADSSSEVDAFAGLIFALHKKYPSKGNNDILQMGIGILLIVKGMPVKKLERMGTNSAAVIASLTQGESSIMDEVEQIVEAFKMRFEPKHFGMGMPTSSSSTLSSANLQRAIEQAKARRTLYEQHGIRFSGGDDEENMGGGYRKMSKSRKQSHSRKQRKSRKQRRSH